MSRYTKTIVGLLGALATWAISTFPGNHQVQIIAGLVVALGTAFGVYQFPNSPPAGQPSDPNISETDPVQPK